MIKRASKAGLRLVWFSLFLLLLLFASLAASVRYAPQFFNNYRADVEQWVSSYIQQPVSIEALDVTWVGFGPRVTFRDVALLDKERGEPLQVLDNLYLNLDLRAWVLNGGLALEAMVLDGLSLDILYQKGGTLRLKGLPAPSSNRDDMALEEALDWLFSIRNLALLSSKVTVEREDTGAIYYFSDANIRIANTDGEHLLNVDVALPQAFGDSLTIEGRFTGDVDDRSSWQGEFSAASGGLQLASWFAASPKLPFNVHKGLAAFDLRGQISSGQLSAIQLTSEVEAPKVQRDDKAWQLDYLASSVQLQRQKEGLQLNVEGAILREGKTEYVFGPVALSSSATVAQGKRYRGAGSTFDISVTRVLLPLLDVLSVDEALVASLRQAEPKGQLAEWAFTYLPDAPARQQVTASAQFSGVGLTAMGHVPGVSGLDGTFNWVNESASIALNSKDVVFNAPSLFKQALTLDKVNGGVHILLADGQTTLYSPTISLENQDLAADARLRVDLFEGQSPLIDLFADIKRGDGTHAARYYPVEIMTPSLVAWLEKSIKGGQVKQGHVILHGPAKGFPYKDHSGVFVVDVDVEEGHLNFQDGWPALTDVAANLRFDGPGMVITSKKAKMNKSDVLNATVTAENLAKTVLQIDGKVDAPIQDLLDFTNTGPLSAQIGDYLGGGYGEGRGTLDLSVTMPLQKGAKTNISGAVAIDASSLRSERYKLDFKEVTGTIRFSEKSLAIDTLRAKLDGEPIRIDAGDGRSHDGREITRLSMSGKMDPSKVLKRYGVDFKGAVRGASEWRVRVDVGPDRSRRNKRRSTTRVELYASSNMVGTRVALLAPLNKQARQAKPFTISADLTTDDRRMLWRLGYGAKVNMSVSIPVDDVDATAMAVHFGRQRPSQVGPESLRLSGVIPRLDVDELVRLDALFSPSKKSASSTPFTDQINLKVNTLKAASATLTNLHVQGSGRDNLWQGTFKSQQVSGWLRIPKNFKTGTVKATLSDIDLTTLLAGVSSDSSSSQKKGTSKRLDPRGLPALDISAKSLKWKQFIFANVQLQTQPTRQGMVIRQAGFSNGFLQLKGDGAWQVAGQRQSSQVQLTLTGKSFGKGFDAMGLKGTLGEGEGAVTLNLGWNDALYAVDKATLKGDMSINVKKGRILSVDPGVGRIFGLFALQALPRRLTLDFKDLLRSGLEYDSIRGHFTLRDGVAQIDQPIKLEGPIGEVKVEGELNYVEQTYNQQVLVNPKVTSSLPVLGAITAGPAAGVTILLADKVLKGVGVDLDKVVQRRFSLTGSWDTPNMEEIKPKEKPRPTLSDDDYMR